MELIIGGKIITGHKEIPSFQRQVEKVNGRIKYLARCYDMTAVETTPCWEILKVVYDLNNNYKKQSLTGAWSERENLNWTI